MTDYSHETANNGDWHDGTMKDNCPTCAAISSNPCEWCGYGHIFMSHNPLAHAENGDPNLPGGEEDPYWTDKTLVAPYDRDLKTYEVSVTYFFQAEDEEHAAEQFADATSPEVAEWINVLERIK